MILASRFVKTIDDWIWLVIQQLHVEKAPRILQKTLAMFLRMFEDMVFLFWYMFFLLLCSLNCMHLSFLCGHTERLNRGLVMFSTKASLLDLLAIPRGKHGNDHENQGYSVKWPILQVSLTWLETHLWSQPNEVTTDLSLLIPSVGVCLSMSSIIYIHIYM